MRHHLWAVLLFWALNPTVSVAQLNCYQAATCIDLAKSLCFNNLDSALLYAKHAVLLATKKHDIDLEYKSFRTLGRIYEENNRNEEAISAYKRAMDLAENSLTVQDQLDSYTDWAIVHKKIGNFKVATEYHQKTIQIAEQHQNWKMAEVGYHGLGTMYSMMSDFDKAISWYHKSILAAEKANNLEGKVLSQQNIGNIYIKAKNYDMARLTLEKAYQEALILKDTFRIGTVLKTQGNLYAATQNLDSACLKHHEALAIFRKLGKKAQKSESYLALIDIYLKKNDLLEARNAFTSCAKLEQFFSPYTHAMFHNLMGHLLLAENKPNEAISCFKNSLEKTKKFGFKEIAYDNHLKLVEAYHTLKKDSLAFGHHLEANALAESIFEDQKQKTMTEAQFKYDLAELDHQVASQTQSLQQSKVLKIVLASGLLVLSVLLAFTYRQVKLKESALLHSELLMKELHHRVKNNFQTIISLMRIQARKVSNPEVLEVLNESRSRLEMISLLHQQLYQNSDVKAVNMPRFLNDLVEKLKFTYGFMDNRLDIQLSLESEEMDVDKAIPLSLIINELLTNSFKYAIPFTEKDPCIKIHISSKKVTYSDNGPGVSDPSQLENSSNFGFHLINSLCKQLKCTYKTTQSDGLTFEMFFSK